LDFLRSRFADQKRDVVVRDPGPAPPLDIADDFFEACGQRLPGHGRKRLHESAFAEKFADGVLGFGDTVGIKVQPLARLKRSENKASVVTPMQRSDPCAHRAPRADTTSGGG
jgi:hypothetical protein